MRPLPLTIRPARGEDAEAMFALRTSVTENHMSAQALAAIGVSPQTLPAMLQGRRRGWVAHVGDTLVGFSMADADAASVFALFVRPGHDGLGIGRQLMHATEGWLQQNGCNTAWLATDGRPHVRAHGFYQRLGWTAEQLQPDGQRRYVKTLQA